MPRRASGHVKQVNLEDVNTNGTFDVEKITSLSSKSLRDLHMSMAEKWVRSQTPPKHLIVQFYHTVGRVLFSDENRMMGIACTALANSMYPESEIPGPLCTFNLDNRWLEDMPIPDEPLDANGMNAVRALIAAINPTKISLNLQTENEANQTESQQLELLRPLVGHQFSNPFSYSAEGTIQRLERIIRNFGSVLLHYIERHTRGATTRNEAIRMKRENIIRVLKAASPGTYRIYPGVSFSGSYSIFEIYELQLYQFETIQKQIRREKAQHDAKRAFRQSLKEVAQQFNVQMSWGSTKQFLPTDPRDVLKTKLELFPRVYQRSCALFNYNKVDMYAYCYIVIENIDMNHAIPSCSGNAANVREMKRKRNEILMEYTNEYLTLVERALNSENPMEIFRVLLPVHQRNLLGDAPKRFRDLLDRWKYKKPVDISTYEEHFQQSINSLEGCQEDREAKLIPIEHGRLSAAFLIYKLKLLSDVARWYQTEQVNREKSFIKSTKRSFERLFEIDTSNLSVSEGHLETLKNIQNMIKDKQSYLELIDTRIDERMKTFLTSGSALLNLVGIGEENHQQFDRLRENDMELYRNYTQTVDNFENFYKLRSEKNTLKWEIYVFKCYHLLCGRLKKFVLMKLNRLGEYNDPEPNLSIEDTNSEPHQTSFHCTTTDISRQEPVTTDTFPEVNDLDEIQPNITPIMNDTNNQRRATAIAPVPSSTPGQQQNSSNRALGRQDRGLTIGRMPTSGVNNSRNNGQQSAKTSINLLADLQPLLASHDARLHVHLKRIRIAFSLLDCELNLVEKLLESPDVFNDLSGHNSDERLEETWRIEIISKRTQSSAARVLETVKRL